MCPGPGQEENRARGPRFSGPWISIGSGPGTQGPGLEGKLLHLYAFINRYIYIYIYIHIIYMYILICISAICFEHVGGHGMGMFPGPG